MLPLGRVLRRKRLSSGRVIETVSWQIIMQSLQHDRSRNKHPRFCQRSRWQRKAPNLLGIGFARSDAECALVGEKRRRAACVHEDDVLVLAPTPLADQGDQARETLARIDRIKWKSLELARKPDRFDGGLVRDPVGGSRMPRDDFYPGFVERNIEQIGRFPRQRYDIGSHPRGLGVDINPNDPCVWHCHCRTDDETSLRAGASGAVRVATGAKPNCAACGSISAIVVA